MAHGRGEEINWTALQPQTIQKYLGVFGCVQTIHKACDDLKKIDHVLNVLQVKVRFPSTPAPLATTANNSIDSIVTFHAMDIKHGLKDDPPKKRLTKKSKTACPFFRARNSQ